MKYHLYNQVVANETAFRMQTYADWKLGAPPTVANRTYHILFISKGQGQVMYEFNTYDFEAPCALFFAAYQPFKVLTNEGIEGTVMQFATDFFCIDHHS